jgi:hypothetical protein
LFAHNPSRGITGDGAVGRNFEARAPVYSVILPQKRGRFMIDQSTSRIRSLRALLTLLIIAVLAGTLLAKGTFPAGTYASGDFTVTFRSDGTFRVSERGDAVVDGSYTVEANRITLTDKGGRYACVAEGPGKYTWRQNGLWYLQRWTIIVPAGKERSQRSL